ncbi:ankyrin repeat-containing domain protein [Aspergillus lucknowensis]|uniref:Ankyrin repeat-containing domain protein n=1 Tax=Aspergillus lucknowensis TaxID=176173 RepID=A0ABR4LSA8_9EURO
MSLQQLPRELLLNIFESLGSRADSNSFARTCRQFHCHFNTYLYRYAIRNCLASVSQWAAEHGQVRTLEHLVAEAADLVSDPETTPLFGAAKHGQVEVIRFLDEHGADAEWDDGLNRPALLYAIRSGFPLDVIERLVAKTPTKVIDNCGCLGRAVMRKRTDVVKLLLAAGVDIDARGIRVSALEAAMDDDDDTDMLRFLLDAGASPNAIHPEVRPPLQAAAIMGFVNVVRILLERGADPAYVDTGGTSLASAASAGHYEVAKLLSEAGAPIDIKDSDSDPLLYGALASRHEDIAVLLAEHGAELDPPYDPEFEWTPLIGAIRSGSQKVVELLLKNKVDVQQGADCGQAPITLAAENGRPEFMKPLLSHGADICATDEHGRTALALAAAGGWLRTVVALLDYGTDSSSTRMADAECSSDFRTQSGHNIIDKPDNYDRTPLFYATIGGHEATVAVLLAHGSAAADFSTAGNRSPQSFVAQLPDCAEFKNGRPAAKVMRALFENPSTLGESIQRGLSEEASSADTS